MNAQKFAALAVDHNRIPVFRDVLADLDTPVSAYLKLADRPNTFLFESVEGGDKWGRYSFIGLGAKEIIKVVGNDVELLDGENPSHIIEQCQTDDPLTWIEQYRARYSVPEVEELPAFFGGLVGYFGYDTVRYVETRLAHSTPEDTLGVPDILLLLVEDVLVFDNLNNTVKLITHAEADGYEAALLRLNERERELGQAIEAPLVLATGDLHESDFTSSIGQAGYMQAVETIREYVLAGDAMQVVPSQRLSAAFSAPPMHFYRALRHLNPSPYLFFLNLGEFHIVGSSPEILARLEDNVVTLRPIAGTRRRGKDEAEDLALEAELLADPKELAEHLMLIDLGRNDVGRVANTGTVELTDKMVIERYSHVMHIVSNVTGNLREGLNAIDVLRASLPAGTLSGAPKVRAMEIIDELETVKRGVYGGAVGYIGWHGNMDTAIAIRTAVIKDATLHIQAGAGIVADSDPQSEWEETLNKARALIRAANLVSGTTEQRAAS